MSGEVRFPGYDVLAKRDGESWNEATRRTLDARLSAPREPRFFNPAQWQTLCALCDRIIPQPRRPDPVPLASMLDARLLSGRTDGFRRAGLPQQDEAWRRGLAALDAEARVRHGAAFHELTTDVQEQLLHKVQAGEVSSAEWRDLSSQEFFCHRVILDIAAAYYAHPAAWNEIGFGGPASPRGYVRMDFDRRDPWEAAEAQPGEEEQARRDNQRVR